MIRKTVTITQQQNDWIKLEMAQGRYGNESELIRDLIRDRQRQQDAERETLGEISILRQKLEKAEASGFIEQSESEMLSEFKSMLRVNG